MPPPTLSTDATEPSSINHAARQNVLIASRGPSATLADQPLSRPVTHVTKRARSLREPVGTGAVTADTRTYEHDRKPLAVPTCRRGPVPVRRRHQRADLRVRGSRESASGAPGIGMERCDEPALAPPHRLTRPVRLEPARVPEPGSGSGSAWTVPVRAGPARWPGSLRYAESSRQCRP